MPDSGKASTDWPAVSGRALAFMCLAQAGLTEKGKGKAEQGQFLEDRLGMSRKDAGGPARHDIGFTYRAATTEQEEAGEG